MSSPAIATITEMMKSLPEPLQERVVEHLKEYLQEVRDEEAWDEHFRRTQPQLVAAARRAREEIAQGKSRPLDLDEL